eukprot:2343907-Pyramimonas_sp.AAC.1
MSTTRSSSAARRRPSRGPQIRPSLNIKTRFAWLCHTVDHRSSAHRHTGRDPRSRTAWKLSIRLGAAPADC